jgi:hypothetical protein
MDSNKNESKVTKTVRDGVVKAIHTGEDIAKTVGIITRTGRDSTRRSLWR